MSIRKAAVIVCALFLSVQLSIAAQPQKTAKTSLLKQKSSKSKVVQKKAKKTVKKPAEKPFAVFEPSYEQSKIRTKLFGKDNTIPDENASETPAKAAANSSENIAEQLKKAQKLVWSGNLAGAERIYTNILSQNPENVDALIGKAEILSWQDRLDESYNLYIRALRTETNSIKAKNGLARVTSWKGELLQSISDYKRIILAGEADSDTYVGIYWVYRWIGRDDLAHQALKDAISLEKASGEVQKLLVQYNKSKMPYVKIGLKHWDEHVTDVSGTYYDQGYDSQGIRAGSYIDDMTNFEISYEKIRMSKTNDITADVLSDRIGIGAGRIFNDQFELHSYLYFSSFDKLAFAPVTANIFASYKYNPSLRFDVAYERDYFEDVKAISNEVSYDSNGGTNPGHVISDGVALAGEWRPNRYWVLNGKYKKSTYSDSNSQNILQFKGEYRFLQNPETKLTFNVWNSTWAKTIYAGYYNAETASLGTVGILQKLEISKDMNATWKANVGMESQKFFWNAGTGSHPIFGTSIELTNRLTRDWNIIAFVEYFEGKADTYSQGYIRKTAELGLSYNFESSAINNLKRTNQGRPTGN